MNLLALKSEKKTQVNQWQYTISVIEWFKAIENTSKNSFIKFCPSIFKELATKAIENAQSVTIIEEKLIKTI